MATFNLSVPPPTAPEKIARVISVLLRQSDSDLRDSGYRTGVCGPRRRLRFGARVFALALTVLLLLYSPSSDAEPHAPVIVVFGDSFTAGLGLSPEEAFPTQLEAWLNAHGKPARVVGAGKIGDTTEAALSRLDKAIAEHPDIVILELGANDDLRGVDPAITRANLGTMITKFREDGAKVLLTGILAPRDWGEEYTQAFNRVYPDLARSYDVPLYPSILDGVARDPQLNQPDGLHPNSRGVAIIVSRLGPVLVSLFFAEPAAESH